MLKKIPFITSVICALIAVFTFQINDSFAAIYKKGGNFTFGSKDYVTQKFYLPKKGVYTYKDSSKATGGSWYYVCLYKGSKSISCKQLFTGKNTNIKFSVPSKGYYKLKFIDTERVGGSDDYVYMYNYSFQG